MEKITHNYRTDVGFQVIIWITGDTRTFIAEVTQQEPELRLKVEENGPYAHLKPGGDYIIKEYYTSLWQGGQASATKLLRDHKEAGRPIYSGLKALGIEDGDLHEVWPDENA